jgi:hypothetical protein
MLWHPKIRQKVLARDKHASLICRSVDAKSKKELIPKAESNKTFFGLNYNCNFIENVEYL